MAFRFRHLSLRCLHWLPSHLQDLLRAIFPCPQRSSHHLHPLDIMRHSPGNTRSHRAFSALRFSFHCANPRCGQQRAHQTLFIEHGFVGFWVKEESRAIRHCALTSCQDNFTTTFIFFLYLHRNSSSANPLSTTRHSKIEQHLYAVTAKAIFIPFHYHTWQAKLSHSYTTSTLFSGAFYSQNKCPASSRWPSRLWALSQPPSLIRGSNSCATSTLKENMSASTDIPAVWSPRRTRASTAIP